MINLFTSYNKIKNLGQQNVSTTKDRRDRNHGLQTPREEIAFTARPKIQSQSQIFRYGRSIFCLPHRPNFSDIFDLCLHWVSVVRACTESKLSLLLTLPIPAAWCPNVEPVLKITWKIVSYIKQASQLKSNLLIS